MKLLKCYIVIVVLALAFSPAIIYAEYLWHSRDLDPPNISLGSISHQGDEREGSATIILDVNDTVPEAYITAETSSVSQLTYTGVDRVIKDTLVTEYWIETDGDGVNSSGATEQAVIDSSAHIWTAYDHFLTTPLKITYRSGDSDGAVVTLHVKASNITDNVADSGLYSATQTLTVSW
jgi:hypothetical protein